MFSLFIHASWSTVSCLFASYLHLHLFVVKILWDKNPPKTPHRIHCPWRAGGIDGQMPSTRLQSLRFRLLPNVILHMCNSDLLLIITQEMEVDIERSFPSKVLKMCAALSEKFICPQDQLEFQNNAIKLWKTRTLLHKILKDRQMGPSGHSKSPASTSLICVQLKLTKNMLLWCSVTKKYTKLVDRRNAPIRQSSWGIYLDD